MRDWVECLHQIKKRERLHYCTVQNHVVCSLAREKVNSINMHPDVIAQTDKIHEGNRKILVELKADLVGTLQKRQRDGGQYKAMQYFMQDITKRLTWWAPLFNDGKVDLYSSKNAHILCHLVKELENTKL
jgi:hypothetical protein